MKVDKNRHTIYFSFVNESTFQLSDQTTANETSFIMAVSREQVHLRECAETSEIGNTKCFFLTSIDLYLRRFLSNCDRSDLMSCFLDSSWKTKILQSHSHFETPVT